MIMKQWFTIFSGLVFLAGPELSAKVIEVPSEYHSIQEAVDTAVSGDVILVKPGTYRERICLKSGVTLRSGGPNERGSLGLKRAEETILDGGGKWGGSPGVTMAEGAILDGFTITHVGIFDETLWKKHWVEKGIHQSHKDIGHFGVPGVAITGVTCSVSNNIVHHNGHTGIAVRGENGKKCSPYVSGNVCYRNMGSGIGSMAGSRGIINGNTCFENFFAGIGHNDASPVVEANVCYNNVRAGIGISNGASPVVRRNRCYANRRAGIGIRTGSDTLPVVEGNDCYENEMAGIGCSEKSTPILRRNRCYRNKLAGIGCSDRASPVVEENHCFENEAAGIGSEAASPIILRNILEKNASAGIVISNKSNVIVFNNQCLENKLVAIGIRDGSEAMLKENTLVRSVGMPPIVAILDNSKVNMIDNRIVGGGVAGILLQGSLIAAGNILEGKNGGNGISICKGSEVRLLDNHIIGYKSEINDQRNK